MDRRCIVFDFDGTLADVEHIIIEVYEELAAQHGWPELDNKTIRHLRKGGAIMAMRMLHIKLWQLPKLLHLGRTEYKKRLRKISLFPGVKQMLKEAAKEYDVYVLSSNDEKSVKKILQNNNVLTDVKVLKGSPIFGKDKELKKLLKSKKYKADLCFMVGDESRDIEAGKKAGMKTIAVTWGLQNRTGLEAAKPAKIIKDPKDFKTIISF